MTRSDRDERHSLAFFRGFLRKPEVVGSVIPSSRFLERRVVASCELGEARCVVELGPGTGGTTRALLAAMPSQAHLLAVEVEADFVEVLAQHEDPRLIARQGSAEAIAELLADNGAARVIVATTHAVFSGPAIDSLKNSAIETVIATDTLPLPSEKLIDKIEVLSVAPIIARAISAVFEDTSVSEIFGGNNLA